MANRASSLPVAYRLYLPESWAQDDARRRKAGVPERIEFQTKPKIALQQIEWACAAGLARGVVEMDCAYGSDLSLRRRLTALELTYAVGVWARTLVRKLERGAGRGDAKPVTAAGLAQACRSGPGARSPGATAPTHGWSRVSPACGCVPPARARAVRSPRSG